MLTLKYLKTKKIEMAIIQIVPRQNYRKQRSRPIKVVKGKPKKPRSSFAFVYSWLELITPHRVLVSV